MQKKRPYNSGGSILILMVTLALIVIVVGFWFAKFGDMELGSAKVEQSAIVANEKDLSSTKKIMPRRSVRAELTALNDSRENGSAIIHETKSGITTTISLVGVPDDIEQPTHIHMGTCDELGEVLYTLKDVTLSKVDGNTDKIGQSQTEIPASFDTIFTTMPISINVHLSADEANVYVACGDIKKPSALHLLNLAQWQNAKLQIDANKIEPENSVADNIIGRSLSNKSELTDITEGRVFFGVDTKGKVDGNVEYEFADGEYTFKATITTLPPPPEDYTYVGWLIMPNATSSSHVLKLGILQATDNAFNLIYKSTTDLSGYSIFLLTLEGIDDERRSDNLIAESVLFADDVKPDSINVKRDL